LTITDATSASLPMMYDARSWVSVSAGSRGATRLIHPGGRVGVPISNETAADRHDELTGTPAAHAVALKSSPKE
jgi:hypothetical protein